MRRWLVFSLGLALAGVGLWALLTTSLPPEEEIGDASRAALERVLRDAPGEDPTR